MNRKHPAFKELTGALQVMCRELRREGVRANVKHAAVFSPAEENACWDLKVISDRAPVALQTAVFFYVGKNAMHYCCVQSLWLTLNFNYLHHDFQLYLHPGGICVPPRTSWRMCILPKMYILGNI